MKTVWARIFCRLLIALMIWTPYQFATAGMIGTDQVASVSTQAERAAVLGFVNRGDVTRQLQAMGIDPKTAQDRIAALSDRKCSRSPARSPRCRPAPTPARPWARSSSSRSSSW